MAKMKIKVENEILKIGNPPISISVGKSRIAKNYSIRISNNNGSAKLTIPRNGTYQKALKFAKSKENWIRKKLLNQLPEITPCYGSVLLYQGKKLIIRQSEIKNIYQDENEIFIPGPLDKISGKIKGYLKVKARDHLDFSSKKYSNLLGKSYKKITIRDTRSRWGSCTSDGNLMYSWRLIMAPPDVLNYVAAHEVAHLSHLNHSEEFWGTVEFLMPDFKKYKNWLKNNGQLLHRYRF
jgi:hypothetical protein